MTGPVDLGSPPVEPPQRAHRRLLLIIVPLVLVVVAAVAGAAVLLTADRSITAAGTVADALTGRPLAAAVVTADGHTTSTDALGGFRLAALPKGAMLDVRLGNYVPATVEAASGPVTIRLAPIAVPATVTSTLTKGPVAASIELPDKTRVAGTPAGAATVYRVGPGDRVTVTAAGYRAREVSVSEDRTITAALSPTWQTAAAQVLAWVRAKQDAAVVNWVLSPATGFRYAPVEPPPPSGQPTPGIWETSRQVVGSNATVFLSVLQSGIVDEGATFTDGGTRVTIAGKPARHGSLGDGIAGTSWFASPLHVMVVGQSLAVTDKVMRGILAAQPAS
jgi:hypothetical protein